MAVFASLKRTHKTHNRPTMWVLWVRPKPTNTPTREGPPFRGARSVGFVGPAK